MQTHEVTLNDGQVVHGLLSFIDHDNEEFYLLDQQTLGMIGQKGAGTRYRFDQCRCVYVLMPMDGRMVRQSDEQIAAWRRWARKADIRS